MVSVRGINKQKWLKSDDGGGRGALMDALSRGPQSSVTGPEHFIFVNQSEEKEAKS